LSNLQTLCIGCHFTKTQLWKASKPKAIRIRPRKTIIPRRSTSFRLPMDVVATLTRWASAADISVSAVIINCVRQRAGNTTPMREKEKR
jgi:hypothetical protein